MPICYVVPGYAGSSLVLVDGSNQTIWADRTQLGLGRVMYLYLADDGFSPSLTYGKALAAGVPLKDYYSTAINLLSVQLGDEGYIIRAFPYDWRLTMFTSGKALANKIMAEVKESEPCSIVAHSFGGLVTRVAWQELGRQGKQALLRRIVTLGTPHQGSYQGVGYISQVGETLDQLVWLYNEVPLLQPITGAQSKALLAQMMASWPSLYETFPMLGVPDAAGDLRREELYQKANWLPITNVKQQWLDHAKNVVQPFLKDSSSMPPPWVLTCVAAKGEKTFDSLDDGPKLGDAAALHISREGDGAVMASSALADRSTRYTLQGVHHALPYDLAVNGALAEYILEQREPPPPADRPEPVPAIVATDVPNPIAFKSPPLPFGVKWIYGG
jgi:hypothetical protein